MPFWDRKKPKDSTPKPTQSAPQNTRPTPAGNYRATLPGLAQVKNIIAIGSGKGGVGKSTVSTNLAVALKHLGYKVGLLDADIYGPSQSGLLGGNQSFAPQMQGQQLMPVEKYGVKFMSMGVVSGKEAPVVWRAPMATKMLQTFMNVAWGELDYLLIDMPPGTGDVQITLAQQASLTGAIIVSTPQEVALSVAVKGLKMFEQVNVPILGIIENMSGFTCPHCAKETKVFKVGGAEKLAQELKVPFLGSLPLDPQIMMSGDEGVPLFEQKEAAQAKEALRSLCQALEKSLEDLAQSGGNLEPLQLQVGEAGDLKILWNDETSAQLSGHLLRTNCQCASCVDENTGAKILDPKKVPLDIKVLSAKPIGRYGLAFQFSDGHSTGIYKFTHLKKLGELIQEQSFEV